MSSFTLFFLLLSLSASFCDCRMLPIERNLVEKWKGLLHTIGRISAQDEALDQTKKVDVIQELISGFKRILYHGSSKGIDIKMKVMRSGSRHKLLGYASNEGETKFMESRTVEGLVAMDYTDVQPRPSVHNR